MLVLLPPSETKRLGGDLPPLDLAALRFGELLPQRERTVDAVVALSADRDEAQRVLKLSERQLPDIDANAALRSTATLPAVDRYTGVVFDALDASSLSKASRGWLGEHVLLHSAPFGPVGALDPIPAYRLSAGTSLPGLGSLRRVWADAVSAVLAQTGEFILDLRSEAYASLGPVSDGVASAYVRVVTAASDGSTRALNHFNKHAKGAFVRALAEDRPRAGTERGIRSWAAARGFEIRDGAPGEWNLVV